MKKVFLQTTWFNDVPAWAPHLGYRFPTTPTGSEIEALANKCADLGWYSRDASPEDYKITHTDGSTTFGYYWGDGDTVATNCQAYVDERATLVPVGWKSTETTVLLCDPGTHPTDNITETFELAAQYITP